MFIFKCYFKVNSALLHLHTVTLVCSNSSVIRERESKGDERPVISEVHRSMCVIFVFTWIFQADAFIQRDIEAIRELIQLLHEPWVIKAQQGWVFTIYHKLVQEWNKNYRNTVYEQESE